MKPKATLRLFLALAGCSMFAISSASAQATYTWTQTAAGDQDWTTAANWSGGTPFDSGTGNNELRFFADNTAQLAAGLAGASQVVTNVPTSLSMNTLTLNGKGPNNTLGASITIGTSASTWTLGDGTISTVNLNSILGGGGADRDLRYTIGANLTLVGDASGITTFTGNSTSGIGALFSGNITGSGKGITKSGSSLLVFSGNNSYTGTTSVTGGVLRLSSANALNGGTGTTGGLSALTLNGGVLELGAGDFSRGLGTGSSQFQITGGISGFSAYGAQRVVTVGGDASQELTWGSTYFQPSTLVLNQAFGLQATVYANGSIELTNGIDLNGATRTVQVNANKALISGDIRTSSGTAGLIKTGAGTLVLTGNNTYNGTTTVSAGTLNIGSASSIGGSGFSNLSMNGGTLQITGTALTSLSDLDSTVTFSNTAKGFDIQSASNTFTVDQVLSGTGTGSTLTKSGVGTLVLNQNNTYAGATTVTGGGTLVLDYTTNNLSKLSDTQSLTLSGTALVLKGGTGTGANHLEVVSSTVIGGGTTTVTGTGNSISRDGGTSQISLGAISGFSGTNLSTLAIDAPGTDPAIATTTTTNTSGILTAGRVTVGDHFAAHDGTPANNIVAYSAYTDVTTAGGNFASNVTKLTGGGTMTANLTSYALRIINSGSSDTLNLGTGIDLLLSNNSTLLYAGGGNNEYTISGSSTSEVRSASGNQPFVINTATGTKLTINAGFSISAGGLGKAGFGTLVVGGDASAMTGPVYVQQGVLRMASAKGAGGDAGGLTVQGGAALELSNNITVGAKALAINGTGISNNGALRNFGGSNTYGGLITIGASGARINADASTSLTLTGGIATTAIQDVTFGGAGDTSVSTTGISGSGGVIKDGAGTLTLSTANTYTGATTISSGTLVLAGGTQATNSITFTAGSLGLDTGVTVTAASAAVNLTNGTIKVTGTTGNPSYTLLTAASITGVPVLATSVPGYELQVIDGATDQLRLVQTGGASPYDTWSGGAPFDGDANGDGVDNGLAFLLGAATPGANATGLLPTVSNTGGNLVMSFTCLATADRGTSTLTLEYDGDLAGTWLSVPVPGAVGAPNPIVENTGTGSVSFNATDGGTNGNGDALINVVATISDATESASGKLFGRLKAENP